MVFYEDFSTKYRMCARDGATVNWRHRPPVPATIKGCGYRDGLDWIYWYRDRDRTLLYVGIASNAEQRARGHRAASIWWPFVRMGRSHPVPAEESESTEQYLIQRQRPLFNTAHSTIDDEQRVEYLARHEAWDLLDEFMRRRRIT